MLKDVLVFFCKNQELEKITIQTCFMYVMLSIKSVPKNEDFGLQFPFIIHLVFSLLGNVSPVLLLLQWCSALGKRGRSFPFQSFFQSVLECSYKGPVLYGISIEGWDFWFGVGERQNTFLLPPNPFLYLPILIALDFQ